MSWQDPSTDIENVNAAYRLEREENERLRAEVEQWKEAWRARGRRINGVGEFAHIGAWEPVRKVQNRMLHGVVETLEDAYHPQNPTRDHPADIIRKRYPHLLAEDDEPVATPSAESGPS